MPAAGEVARPRVLSGRCRRGGRTLAAGRRRVGRLDFPRELRHAPAPGARGSCGRSAADALGCPSPPGVRHVCTRSGRPFVPTRAVCARSPGCCARRSWSSSITHPMPGSSGQRTKAGGLPQLVLRPPPYVETTTRRPTYVTARTLGDRSRAVAPARSAGSGEPEWPELHGQSGAWSPLRGRCSRHRALRACRRRFRSPPGVARPHGERSGRRRIYVGTTEHGARRGEQIHPETGRGRTVGLRDNAVQVRARKRARAVHKPTREVTAPADFHDGQHAARAERG